MKTQRLSKGSRLGGVEQFYSAYIIFFFKGNITTEEKVAYSVFFGFLQSCDKIQFALMKEEVTNDEVQKLLRISDKTAER